MVQFASLLEGDVLFAASLSQIGSERKANELMPSWAMLKSWICIKKNQLKYILEKEHLFPLAFCAASGFCAAAGPACHSSITAGHLNSFRKKAANPITTDRVNRTFQTGRFRTGTARVEL